MLNRATQIFEVLVLRALPGILNLLALTSAAQWLGSAKYGLFSTGLATSGAAANFLFGPLLHSTVGSYAAFAARGEARRYEEQIFTSCVLVSVIILVPSLVLVAFEVVPWVWIGAVISFGVYTTAQTIHHARVRFIAYGAGAVLQATAFMVLLWFYVRPNPTMHGAVTCFTASYAIGALVSLALAGFPPIRPISWAVLKTPLSQGWPITLSTLAASGFVIGFRYLILGFGTRSQLGVFSFCIDVAQRLIGVVINFATFAVVPRAFHADAQGDSAAFRKMLREGALLSFCAASLLIGIVLAVAWLDLIPALETDVFESAAFAILAVATVVNRTGKMMLTPVAMRKGRTSAVLYGYLIAGPIALGLGFASLQLELPYALYVSFLAGFIVWAGVSAAWLASGSWLERCRQVTRWLTKGWK